MVQRFKGDETELQIEAAGEVAFDVCKTSLDEFYADAFEASDFLLSLYDEGRMPFSDRIPRNAFVDFLRKAIPQFPVTGTFESYLFIIEALFGAGSDVQFTVPAPGKLQISVSATSAISFEFVGREVVDGAYVEVEMIDSDGEILEFRGISGIDSEAKLDGLLSELIPAGIYPEIELIFFTLSSFVGDDGAGGVDFMVDHDGNQLVFFEIGD